MGPEPDHEKDIGQTNIRIDELITVIKQMHKQNEEDHDLITNKLSAVTEINRIFIQEYPKILKFSTDTLVKSVDDEVDTQMKLKIDPHVEKIDTTYEAVYGNGKKGLITLMEGLNSKVKGLIWFIGIEVTFFIATIGACITLYVAGG